MTTVTQGLQTRNYTFDDLGRLLTARIPETNQAATTHAYNSFNLVSQRTDARGVITAYSYDNLNRLTQISYNVGTTGVPPTSTVTLTYDEGGSAANALGRLTTLTDGTGTERYTYNNLGLETQQTKTINGTQYPLVYAYNLAGELTSMTYPSGRVVSQNYDAIGRLCAVGTSGATCTAGTNYVNGFVYNTAGQATAFNYGNGVAAALTYFADRLQMQSLSYAKGATTLGSWNYWYKTDSTNCPGAPAGNNGQIQCITDNVDSGRSVAYAYDALYRATSAVTNGSANYPKWGLSWSYDRYGNRTGQSITSGCVAPMTCPTNSLTFSPSAGALTNRPDGYSFDANGNMTNDGANTLTYDAENHSVSAAGTAYVYDGNGLRVRKCAPDCTSPTSSTLYIFFDSKVIAEYDNGAAVASPSREYVYAGSGLIAKFESGATTYFHPDHLSTRLLTDSSGNSLGQRGHFPFGETWYESGTSTKLKFTSYERDSETLNDFALARYDVSRLGRFSSPDGIAGAVGAPQSLNRYAYVTNDPINAVDPSGMLIIPGGGYVPWGPGFGWNWNEFDLLDRQIGTAPLYHSDNANFPFENYTSDQLSSLADDRVIDYLGRVPVYASTLLESNEENRDRLTSNEKVLKMLYCLWKSGGYGNPRTERSMWITETNGEFGSKQWPWSAESGQETWKGPIPANTIADAHTHPNVMDPKPSTRGGNTGRGDQGSADATNLPFYVVTRDAIWKAVPGDKNPTQVAGSGWWKGAEQQEKKGKLKCPKK